MCRKFFVLALAGIMGMSILSIAACKNTGETTKLPEEGGNTQETVYEGDMLYNGFDSVDDMYRVTQLFNWDYTPLGKLQIVGADNFIPKADNSDAEEAAAAVVVMIDQLPAASAVTEFSVETKNAVAKARRAYGELTDEGKLLVTNLGKLKELEASDVLRGYYTLADLGGDFAANISGAADWAAYSGTLCDPMQGTIVFNVSGIAANTDGAFYVSLFQDPSKDDGQASDGVAVWVRTHNNMLLPQNSTNVGLAFESEEGGGSRTITAEKTYTFYVGYAVAEQANSDVSTYALTISVKIVDAETGEVIADVKTGEITEFTSTNFGVQTIQDWLIDGDNVTRHQTFFISTGASKDVNINSVWTGTKTSDYSEPSAETEDPHNTADLSPRQGDGALRVYYERGSFTEILARFDRSALSDMPIEDKLGGFSVKIYNDSAAEKSVTLSLMQGHNEIVSLENGTFILEPYAWTECKVTLDPIIVNYLAEDLIGIAIRLGNTVDSVYYIDDLRVQFGQTYTDEIKATMETVENLTAGIADIEGKIITIEDKAALETLYSQYLTLPQAYRFTVENIEILNDAIKDYFDVISSAGGTDGEETVLFFNEVLGITQLGSLDVNGAAVSFSSEEHLEGESGSLRLDCNGNIDWLYIPVVPTKNGGFDEVRIWIKNDSDNRRAFYINWKISDAAYGDSIADGKLGSGFAVPANSGWVEIVYRGDFTISEIEAVSLDENGGAIPSVGTLYIGKVVVISHAPDVVAQIEALPEYAAGYSQENKEAVAAARAAYNALSLTTQSDVTNLDKLIAIEADIWREGFASLPESPDGMTEFRDTWKAAIDSLRTEYNKLDNAVKRVVAEEEAMLQAFEEKISEFQFEYVASLMDALTVKDFYTAKDVANIHAARDAYGALDALDQAQIPQNSVQKLNDCLKGIENYYTLSDLSKNNYYSGFSDGDTSIGSWAFAGGNLADSMKGTIVFNATGIMASMDGAMYLTLFHDGSVDKGQASDGIAIWVRTNVNAVLPQNSTDTAISFNDGKTISPNETYTFYVSYHVAADYSKLTITIRIEDKNGEIIAQGTQDITAVTLPSFGKKTIKEWLQEHENAANHQTFYINGGNSTDLVVSDAW